MPGSETDPTREPSTPSQTRALALLALVAVAALVRLALPVGVGILLGALQGFALQSSYERLRRRFRPGPAALIASLGAMGALAFVLSALGYLFVTRGVAIASSVPAALAPGGVLRTLAERSSGLLARIHLTPAGLVARLEGEAVSFGTQAAALAADIATVTFGGLLTIFFMTMTTYVVLRHWTRIVEQAELLLPFNRRHTRALLDQFRKEGRHVLLGTVSTGLIQGALAAIGYFLTGTPEPAFFGALTAVASLVPAVGTLLVWIPLGIFMLATGHPVSGVVILLWGVLVVGILSDYVIRPRLVGQEEGVPAVLTFIALFGGAEVYGLIGLVLGPVIVTLSVAVLRTYREEVSIRRSAISEEI